MQLSQSSSASSPNRRNNRRSSFRVRTKHKRLDAICEKVYIQNRAVKVELNDGNDRNDGLRSTDVDSEVRRSLRVRRVPVMLDASPPPSKKRRKIDTDGESLSRSSENKKNGVNICSPKREDLGNSQELRGWKTRLRSRGKEKGDFPPGKRKLFEDSDGLKEITKGSQLDGMEEQLEGGKSTVVKSKRPGRIKASNMYRKEEKNIESHKIKEDDNGSNEVEVEVNTDDDDVLHLAGGMGCGNEGKTADTNAEPLVEKEQSETPNDLQLEECNGNDNVDNTDQTGEQLEQLNCVEEGENQGVAVQVEGTSTDQLETGVCRDNTNACLGMLDGKSLVDESPVKVDKSNGASTVTLGKSRIKVGRHCSLCGGGNDGKPPKKLAPDMGGSENEACSGSSASEEPNYEIWDGFDTEPSWLGRLLGPINDRFGIAGIWIHQQCAVWSPEVYFAGLGCLKNVRAALCRGRALKCSRCGRPGATIGCRVDRCPKTYHLPCARLSGCIFDHRKFLIACTDHRRLFQPHGNKYLSLMKKMKAKKMKLELRKLTNDAWKKDLEAEEKWLENCGEDEEFLKRESKRLHRDMLRIAPVYIGGPDSESGNPHPGWESVAGLQDVIRCMKEVVILPLLYPEFFTNLGLTPPRGVLLHGYPGTGKTLVVRALIGSCSRGEKKIAYFARKGADCLGKYVGDSERQLRLLFQAAERSQPSIIFFDEIDGLAPRRTRQQDQTHSSVVSTLLALLDGLKSRGSVVVIGATNRPEAVDPALRRPGRFDREIYFPLPSVKDRAAILSLHTQRWPKPVTGSLLKWIATRTAGFAGADLQALCTQATMIALKRNCPLQEFLSTAVGKGFDGNRIPLPAFSVEERDWLEALSCSPPPCSRREAGMAANGAFSSPLPSHLISCFLQPLSSLLVSLHLDERLQLPPIITKAATMIKSAIISVLNKKKMPTDSWWSHVDTFLKEADVAKEIEAKLSCSGILVGDASFDGSDPLSNDSKDESETFEFPEVHYDGLRSSLLQNISSASSKKSGIRILIAGSHRSGQRHFASCLLHCFIGNVEVQKVDLATISQEGHGDVLQGLTQILNKCASLGSCLIFMPRIDLWAIDTHHQVDEKENDSCSTNHQPYEKESCLVHDQVVEKEKESHQTACESAEMEDPQVVPQSASHAWCSFIEQVDSICVSTSLMVLATSEVPYTLLPLRIRQFFKGDISKCSQSTPSRHTVPRFSVTVDGNFNRDIVINSSAAKLSRDVIRQFVQLIHHRHHIHTSSCREYKTSNTNEGNTVVECLNTAHESANENDGITQFPEDSLKKVPPPPCNRTVKGKSSLVLAISTFGYQILLYPQFAELCWVTSKLKSGPCADINGPWKGWPFNSCIVRPYNSLEKIAVACSSSNIKIKENSGLVRGLIAVGLSAYRGVYASLREVSLEVRKVLELLVGQINVKIQAGKDKYQFVRLLSQVAFLEDMVNSWAYTLQSFEADVQVMVPNPKLATEETSDIHGTGVDHLVRSGKCKPNASSRTSRETGMLEECSGGIAAEIVDSVELRNGKGDFGHPISEERVAMPEGCLAQAVVVGHSIRDIHQNAPVADDGVDGKILNVQNGSLKHLKDSNGSVKESTLHSEESLCRSGDLVGVKSSSFRKVCKAINGFSLMEVGNPSDHGMHNPIEHIVSSNKATDLSDDMGVVCLYRCCTECIYALHSLMQKVLMHEWGLHGSFQTIDDVHDFVASISVNILSAFTEAKARESFRYSFDKNTGHGNHGKLFEHQEFGACECKTSESRLFMPMKCSCHITGESLTVRDNSSKHPQLDTQLIYRDGVLAPIDLGKDVSFHCKFETLCLCSLIEWVTMTKQPLN